MEPRLLDVAALVVFGGVVLAGWSPVGVTLVAVAVVMGVAWWRRPVPRLVGALATLGFVPVWQLGMVLALGIWWLADRRWPADWTRGTVPLGWTMLAGLVTPVGLVAWFAQARPDLSDLLDVYVPDVGPGLLLVGAVLFVIANATLEEVLWRGIIQPELTRGLGPAPAILLQAVSFGVVHLHGFPRGWVGVLLAGGWGVLRHRARGLLAPILAHLVADAVIATLVLGWVAGGSGP